jgi:hypothetical protein
MKKNAEFPFLPRELQNTPSGRRYEHASMHMKVMALEIKLMFLKMRQGSVSREIAEPKIHYYRRSYITQSNRASIALDELTKTYNWPPESAADESFAWTPTPGSTNTSPSPKPPVHEQHEGKNLQARALSLLSQGFKLVKVGDLPPMAKPPKSSPNE